MPTSPSIGEVTCGVAEVERRACSTAALRASTCERAASCGGDGVVEFLRADGLLRQPAAAARLTSFCVFSSRACAVASSAFALASDGFERLAIDAVEHLALAHERAFLEADDVEEALDTRPDLDVLEAARSGPRVPSDTGTSRRTTGATSTSGGGGGGGAAFSHDAARMPAITARPSRTVTTDIPDVLFCVCVALRCISGLHLSTGETCLMSLIAVHPFSNCRRRTSSRSESRPSGR